MLFAIVRPRRTKTGLWAVRKEIPKDARRAAYCEREEKMSWPASLCTAQAKMAAEEARFTDSPGH